MIVNRQNTEDDWTAIQRMLQNVFRTGEIDSFDPEMTRRVTVRQFIPPPAMIYHLKVTGIKAARSNGYRARGLLELIWQHTHHAVMYIRIRTIVRTEFERLWMLFLHQPRHKLNKVAGLKTIIKLVNENIVPCVPTCPRAAGQCEQIGPPATPAVARD